MAVFPALLAGVACLTVAQAQVAAPAFSCDFNNGNNGFCGMTRTPATRNLWRTRSGQTSSGSTGPSGGANTSNPNDNYAYTEVSGVRAGTSAILSTPTISALQSSGGRLTFSYHMYGATIGNLSVWSCGSAGCVMQWLQVGAAHVKVDHAWTSATIIVPAGTSRFEFRAVSGTSYTGDMSIDDVVVNVGGGFTLAPTPPQATHTLPACPALPQGAAFRVDSASPSIECAGAGGPQSPAYSPCYTTNGGTCVTDGPLNYFNNERCTITVLRDGWMTVSGTLDLQTNFDGFVFSDDPGRLVSTATAITGRRVTTGMNITWASDSSGQRAGYTLCLSSTASPTPPPPPPPGPVLFSCDFNTPTSGTTSGTSATRYWCGMTHDQLFRVRSGRTGSGGTGPSQGANVSGVGRSDRYAYIEASGTSSLIGRVSNLQTPQFSASAGQVHFSYHMFGSTIGTFSVQACSTPTVCTTIWSRSSQVHTSSADPWSRTTAIFSASTTSIKFRATRGTSYTGDISVDSILVEGGTFTLPPTPTPPACPPLASGAAFQVTAASPPSSCVGGGGPQNNSSAACYTTTGGTCFTDGPGLHGNNEQCTISVLRSGYLNIVPPFSIEGAPFDGFYFGSSTSMVSAMSAIDGRVVAANSIIRWASDSSVLNEGFTLCHTTTTGNPTPSPTAVAAIFTCSFNSGTGGWCGMTRTNTRNNRWRVDTGGGTPSSGTGPSRGQAGTTSDNYAFLETSGCRGGPYYLSTPALNLPQGGRLRFFYHMYGRTMGTFRVRTCAGTNCTTAWTRSGQQQTSNGAAWRQAIVPLPAGTTTIQFVGVCGSSYTGDLAVDTILVQAGAFTDSPTSAPTGPPPCPPPVPGAAFRVSAADTSSCIGGGGYQSQADGTCYTTSSGTCVASVYGNNERCTIDVLVDGFLHIPGQLDVEQCCDGFTFPGSSTLQNRVSQLDNRYVSQGTQIMWQTDGSINSLRGFLMCLVPTESPTATPTRSPTATPTATPTFNPSATPTDSPTFAPTGPPVAPQSGATSGGGSSGGGGMLIWIIVAVVAVLLVAAIVVVKSSGGGGDKSSSGGSKGTRDMSFDNPMYDDVEGNVAGGDPMYDDAEDNVAGEGDENGGYMDVVADENEDF